MAINTAYDEASSIDSSEVQTNRSENCFLTLDGVTGPVTDIVPGAFAIKELFLYYFTDISTGRAGILEKGGIINGSHLTVVVNMPNVLPQTQQDCFDGTLFKTANVQIFGNIVKTNQLVAQINMTDARLALVTANYDPNVSHGIASPQLFGGTTNFSNNRDMLLSVAKTYPSPSHVNRAVFKIAYSTMEVICTKYEDSGQAAGKAATTIDLTKNTVVQSS